MSVERGQFFEVTSLAYRQGVLDKFLPLFGRALEVTREETGATIGDLVNLMDEAQEQTIMKVDTLIGRSGPLLRVANNETVMKLVSRLLDLKLVQNLIIGFMSRSFIRSITGESPPPLPQRIRSFLGSAGAPGGGGE